MRADARINIQIMKRFNKQVESHNKKKN